MRRYFHLIAIAAFLFVSCTEKEPPRPRVLISTDIGGSDPDDNQSMMHYLLFSNDINCEGLISSPSYGDGNLGEILRMIDLYEKDLPQLKRHSDSYPSPDYLRSIAKQGRKGGAPMCGYSEPTEGSEWIVKCARRKSSEPLYVLVWGGLDDLAQALHDAPDIKDRIRVHWIGGPNKKWSINSYVYIVQNFPDLWFIEDNESYRGFIADYKATDRYNGGFYKYFVEGRGHLGEDFYNYKQGAPKLGDTPSLLYMMNGDPSDPEKESWGGSYEKCSRSSRAVFDRALSARDTVQRDGIIEFHVKGPVLDDVESETPVMTLTVDRQPWEGYYMGNGEYIARFSTYKTGTLSYTITSDIEGFPEQSGEFTLANIYPGTPRESDFMLGDSWYTDRSDPELYYDNCQGALTVHKWRETVMEDWGQRCQWLLP